LSRWQMHLCAACAEQEHSPMAGAMHLCLLMCWYMFHLKVLLPVGGSGPHLMPGSLDPPESTPKMASRLIASSVAVGCISCTACRQFGLKSNFCVFVFTVNPHTRLIISVLLYAPPSLVRSHYLTPHMVLSDFNKRPEVS